MENLDDSENNAKISDSAYSNSCSNSQSRRSSKSTHSGSHSSGSSGYGGKPSTGSSNTFSQPPEKRFKENKRKNQCQTETITLEAPKEIEASPELPKEAKVEVEPNDVPEDVTKSPAPAMSPKEHFSENMDVSVMEKSVVLEERADVIVDVYTTGMGYAGGSVRVQTDKNIIKRWQHHIIDVVERHRPRAYGFYGSRDCERRSKNSVCTRNKRNEKVLTLLLLEEEENDELLIL
ncbi:Period circadian protein [Eumeta japonica]|uniref:Period circadian protein n=1 Tax=Eumeta variegata TaxID=151549 RepID=A0A4C1ZL76_EUMVA|nr:Period circadian protein [Eumeta japonica]